MLKHIFFGLVLVQIANGSPIDTQTLLREKDQYQIVDFRSEYMREINGYIAGAVLVPNSNEIGDLNYLQK